ncbi:hypothetical protein JM84_3097 [Dokdonia sp. Hel_I_63]|jgi:hypothetical protein|nr:hypothetical protein JM84_3097 [Dokdonia sp. Hel_I_63]
MKLKFTTAQICTIVLVVFYIIWEYNIQVYLTDEHLDYGVEVRYDLIFILPILVVMIAVSVWQYFKKK